MNRLPLVLVLVATIVLAAGCAGDTGDSGDAGEESLGERIYERGVGSDGSPIDHTDSRDLPNRSSCAVCHGEDGGGALEEYRGPNATATAPSVKFRDLAERGYNETEIRRAVTRGVSSDGHRLGRYMPRWNMSKEEMDALVTYLKDLS